MKTKLLFNGTEFLGQQNIPFTFEDKILLSPGEWNENKYTSKEIEKAFENTDLTDKSNISLYLDHQDTKDQGVGNWIGYAKNLKMDKGTLMGDLEIWNPSMVIYLKEAKAKFGVSATLKGTENEKDGKMEDFHFESFSVVTNPACKDAYINLSDSSSDVELLSKVTDFETRRKSMKMSVNEFYAIPRDPPSDSKLPIFDASHVRNALARFDQVKGVSDEEKEKAKRKIIAAAKKFKINVDIKKLSHDLIIERRIKILNMPEDKVEETASVKETEESKEVDTSKENSSEEKDEDKEEKEKENEEDKKEKEEEKKNQKDDEEEEDELSDKEFLEITTLSDWTDFVKKYKSKNPKASFKEIAKAYKGKSAEMQSLASLSDADLVKKISLLSDILTQRSKKLQEEEESTDDKIEKLSQKISSLGNKLKEPERKTLNAISSSNKIANKDPIAGMVDFISEGGQGVFELE